MFQNLFDEQNVSCRLVKATATTASCFRNRNTSLYRPTTLLPGPKRSKTTKQHWMFLLLASEVSQFPQRSQKVRYRTSKVQLSTQTFKWAQWVLCRIQLCLDILPILLHQCQQPQRRLRQITCTQSGQSAVLSRFCSLERDGLFPNYHKTVPGRPSHNLETQRLSDGISWIFLKTERRNQ